MTPSPGTDTPESAPDGIMVVGGADRGRSVGNALRPLDARDLGAFSGCLGRCCPRLPLNKKTEPTMVPLGPPHAIRRKRRPRHQVLSLPIALAAVSVTGCDAT